MLSGFHIASKSRRDLPSHHLLRVGGEGKVNSLGKLATVKSVSAQVEHPKGPGRCIVGTWALTYHDLGAYVCILQFGPFGTTIGLPAPRIQRYIASCIVQESTQRLQCSSFFGEYIIIPKRKIGHNQKELHWSLWVSTHASFVLVDQLARFGVQQTFNI